MTALSMDRKKEAWRDYYVWLEAISYFFQGYYMSGLSVYMVVMMAGWKLPLSVQAVIAAIAFIPGYLKMFTGLLSDRIPVYSWGRRKPYIILGAALYIPAFVLMILIRDFSWFWVAAVGMAFFAWVLVDGTLDALTVDVTPEEKAGTIQGAANGARAVGYGLAALSVPFLGPKLGWELVIGVIGLFAFLQAVVVLLFRELPITLQELQEKMPVGKVFKQTFGIARSWLAIGFSLCVLAPVAIRNVSQSYLMTTLKWGENPSLLQAYGIVVFIAYLGNLAGALLVGPLLKQHEQDFKAYAWITLASWLGIATWLLLLIYEPTPLLVGFIQFCFGLGLGMITTSAYAIVMQVTPASIEGFFFATLTSAMNIGSIGLGPILITRVGDAIGSMIPAFNVTIIFNILGLVALYFILKQPRQDQFPEGR